LDPKLAFYDALAAHIFTENASLLWAYGLLRAIERRYEPTLLDLRSELGDSEESLKRLIPLGGPDGASTDRPWPCTNPSESSSAQSNALGRHQRSHTIVGQEILQPSSGSPKASTDNLRHTIEEEEQKLQLKERHYGWHCQACLGEYEVIKATPPGSYVYLPSFRQLLIEAHHVTHLQSKGVIGGKNLIIICKFHHYYIGDRLSGEAIRKALSSAKPTVRRFPTNPEATCAVKREGLIAEVEVDAGPWRIRLYFTKQHAAAWLS